MSRQSWKSVVFDELHRIREKLTKEMREINTEEDIERWKRKGIERLKKDGYRYQKTPDGYIVLSRI